MRALPTGVLVESHMGRPTKIEGNPEHPGSLGGTDVFTQASILHLYDPDRSQAVMHDGHVSSWSDFSAAMADARTTHAKSGTGLRLLTKTVNSPTLAAQIRALLAQFPSSKWHQYEPCSGDSVREGARLAFGQAGQHRVSLRSGGRGPIARCGLPYNGCRTRALRSRVFFAPRSCRGSVIESEPAVRCREHGDEHRRCGGPSPAAALVGCR